MKVDCPARVMERKERWIQSASFSKKRETEGLCEYEVNE